MTDEVFFPPYRRRARRWISRSLLPIRRIGQARSGRSRDPESMGNARRAATAMLIAFALFALFESEGIRHFTRDLPGNAVTDVLVRGADRWHALMEDLGPARRSAGGARRLRPAAPASAGRQPTPRAAAASILRETLGRRLSQNSR